MFKHRHCTVSVSGDRVGLSKQKLRSNTSEVWFMIHWAQLGIWEIPRGLWVVTLLAVLANVHGSREETHCGEISVSTGTKHSQRLPAQQKQQMREVVHYQVLSVAQDTYSGTDVYTEYTHIYAYWGTVYFKACCRSTVFISCLGLLQNSFLTT